jgi:hypothetical protein
VINPNPSEQFPPRPNFPLDSRESRRARARAIRWGILGLLLVVGIVMLLLHRYTTGAILVGWAVIRMSMFSVRILRRRKQARDWGGS